MIFCSRRAQNSYNDSKAVVVVAAFDQTLTDQMGHTVLDEESLSCLAVLTLQSVLMAPCLNTILESCSEGNSLSGPLRTQVSSQRPPSSAVLEGWITDHPQPKVRGGDRASPFGFSQTATPLPSLTLHCLLL